MPSITSDQQVLAALQRIERKLSELAHTLDEVKRTAETIKSRQ